MSKTNKMTFNMIASKLRGEKELVKEVEYGDFTLHIKEMLNITEAMSFINGVVDSCCDMNNGTYNPEAYKMALYINTLISYAGFDNPKDIAKAYRVIYETNIYDVVVQNINPDQFEDLCEAIDNKINYIKNTLAFSAAENVNELINKMDAVIADSNNVANELKSDKFKEAIEKINALTGQDAE